MTSPLRISLALYQISGPVVSLVLLSPQFASLGLGFFGVFFLFSALSFAAGVALLMGSRAGWKLSPISQFSQAFGIFSFPFTFMFSCGLSLRGIVGISIGEGTVVEPRLMFSGAWRFGPDLAVGAIKSLPGFPWLGISINAVGLVLAWIFLREVKRPNKSPEPTAMSVTPPAAQEPRQP